MRPTSPFRTDTVGSSGLQAAYEEQLAGTPGGAVSLVDARVGPERRGCCGGSRSSGVSRCGPRCRTTSSRPVSRRWRGRTRPRCWWRSTRVPARCSPTSTGPEITSYDTGLVGRYPPGSTFKVVSSAALIEAGQDIDQQVACPSTTVVDGKRFKNYEFTSLPAGVDVRRRDRCVVQHHRGRPRRRARPTRRCTTSPSSSASGAEWGLPLPAYSGSVPVASSLVDRAASMIGQGRVLMSPLGMALVAAAVSSGQARTPSLIAGERGDDGRVAAGVDRGRPAAHHAARGDRGHRVQPARATGRGGGQDRHRRVRRRAAAAYPRLDDRLPRQPRLRLPRRRRCRRQQRRRPRRPRVPPARAAHGGEVFAGWAAKPSTSRRCSARGATVSLGLSASASPRSGTAVGGRSAGQRVACGPASPTYATRPPRTSRAAQMISPAV